MNQRNRYRTEIQAFVWSKVKTTSESLSSVEIGLKHISLYLKILAGIQRNDLGINIRNE